MRLGYKITNSGDSTIISYRQKEMLQTNQRELGVFDTNAVQGIFKPRFKSANEVEFVAPSCISLKKYLTKDATLEKIYRICSQIFEVFDRVKTNKLYIEHILLDTKYVFVREKTAEIYLIYEPYTNATSKLNEVEFLRSVLGMAKIKDVNQRIEFKHLQEFVSSHDRLPDIENYINRVHYGTNHDGVKDNISRDHSGREEEGTALLDGNEMPTALLSNQNVHEQETTKLERRLSVFLVNANNQKRTQIVNPQCSIGRANDNSFVISNSTDVSRHHAIIFIQGEIFTIKDCGSKNGTVVNGTMIQQGEILQIRNGDVIMFANEKYTFVVEE